MRGLDAAPLLDVSAGAPLTVERLDAEAVTEQGDLAFRVRLPALDRVVPVAYHPDDPDGGWSPYAVGAVQTVLAVPPAERARLRDLLYESYRFHASVTSYGLPDTDDPDDPFGIAGGAEAEQRAGPPRVEIVDPIWPGRRPLPVLSYYPVWEDEHGVSVVVRDGQFVGVVADPWDVGGYA